MIRYNIGAKVSSCTIRKWFSASAIAGFTVNRENIELALGRNPILVTALNPVIGYEKGAAIVPWSGIEQLTAMFADVRPQPPQPVPAGGPGDRDVYGAQQHVPLLGLEV